MVSGVSLESGATAQHHVVEELKPGVEPALTLRQLTEEQTAREMLWKRGLVILTLVQVMDFKVHEYLAWLLALIRGFIVDSNNFWNSQLNNFCVKFVL